MINVQKKLQAQATSFEETLRGYLPDGESVVAQAMRYSLADGGKRIRPALVMAFCALFGGEAEKATPFAVAIEMIHCYSLIHDDLPCMDDDDYRRGRLSCHRKFGEQAALLAGDALLAEAFGVAARADCMAAIAVLARAAGEPGMVGGQWLDLSHENVEMTRAQLDEMNRRKTGALIAAACELGCLAAGATVEQTEAARRYAGQLGLLFQLTDDVLDVTSASEQLGKTAGKDEVAGKNTWVALLGLERAKEAAQELAARARTEIAPFAGEDTLLFCLPGWLVGREY